MNHHNYNNNNTKKRFETRIQSIRSLPNGQFDKFRQMFELDAAMSEERSHRSDVFQKEMNKIFDGVSNETNSLLNTICTNNAQIAEFLVSRDETASFCSSSDNSNKSNSLKSVASTNEWFQAVPVYNVYSKSGSEELNENDVDVEFSDDSFSDLENNVESIPLPPKKPVRTFEHDIYVQTKRGSVLPTMADPKMVKIYDNHVYEALPSLLEEIDEDQMIKTDPQVPHSSQSLLRNNFKNNKLENVSPN